MILPERMEKTNNAIPVLALVLNLCRASFSRRRHLFPLFTRSAPQLWALALFDVALIILVHDGDEHCPPALRLLHQQIAQKDADISYQQREDDYEEARRACEQRGNERQFLGTKAERKGFAWRAGAARLGHGLRGRVGACAR